MYEYGNKQTTQLLVTGGKYRYYMRWLPVKSWKPGLQFFSVCFPMSILTVCMLFDVVLPFLINIFQSQSQCLVEITFFKLAPTKIFFPLIGFDKRYTQKETQSFPIISMSESGLIIVAAESVVFFWPSCVTLASSTSQMVAAFRLY